MNWIRVSPWAGQCGLWTITEMLVYGVSGFLLYHRDECVGKYDTKEAAKAAALSMAKHREAA